MLETSNLVRKCTLIFSFRKYTFQYQDYLNFADVSIFCKKSAFFYQNQYLYSRGQYESYVKDSLVLFSVIVKQKVTVNENYVLQTTRPDSGFRIVPNWAKIQKMTMTPQFADMASSLNFLNVAVFLVSSLVTGPSFTSISLLVLNL